MTSTNYSQLTNPSQHHYRSASYYDLPPMSEKEKREEKKYLHVLDDQ
jgi:NADH dehydrogenase (ubiquinone) 1 alpha subcomplex subunit 9